MNQHAIDGIVNGTFDRVLTGLGNVPILILFVAVAIGGLWFLFERVGR